ncbi:MAG: hypothetical protein JSV84_13230 [Gemmatimonadota bacterium]|nr:MAG: hypothetical protein JSV84_13230 [Gemmatimonadota bacterium]
MVYNENDQWSQNNSTEDENICKLIEEIPGVICLKVWQHSGEYHCVVRAERVDLRRASNEIRTLLHNRKGIEIREENIHFTMAGQQIETPKVRIELLSVHIRSTMNSYGVDVTLKYRENEVTGHAEGAFDGEERLKIAGEATREALTKLIPGKGRLVVREIERMKIKDKEIIISLITISYRGERIHCGAALNRGDDCEAVIRAILDAVNRYIDVLLNN